MVATKSALRGSPSAAAATKSALRGSLSAAPARKFALRGSPSAAPATKSVHKKQVKILVTMQGRFETDPSMIRE